MVGENTSSVTKRLEKPNVGEYRAGCVRVVAGARVVRLAEVVGGGQATNREAQKRNIPKV